MPNKKNGINTMDLLQKYYVTMRNTLMVSLLILLTYVPANLGSSVVIEPKEGKVDLAAENRWVNQIYDAMTEDERIGQLIMIRAHSNKGAAHEREVQRLIKTYHVGGLCFFQGTPLRQVQLINRYQKLATKIPMMVAIDGEWGLGMRFRKHTISYPRQLMLGAIQDNRLLYELGQEVARQCKRIGVHVNFAPVVDVNNNPNNPVINDRSFGEDRYNVAAKSYMYMMGMQDNGLMACAKHFPGHGDTDVDSHHGLPVINHPRYRLDSIELYPFNVLAQHDVWSMMVAHLNIPALDNTHKLPSSLSGKIITDVLRHEMGYEGLIFTDGLEMAGARKAYRGGEVEARALMAGNDILLLPPSTDAAVRAIKKAIVEGRITQWDLEQKVKRVLRSKYRLNLTYTPAPIATQNLMQELNSHSAKALKRRLIENAITAVRNKNALLPLRQLDGSQYASVSIGRGYKTKFQKELDFYMRLRHYSTGKEVAASRSASLIRALKNKEAVIVSLHRMSKSARKNYGLSASARQFIQKLSEHTRVILVVFGSPYSLKYFDGNDWVVMAYDEGDITQKVTAQALFGSVRMRGRLPVSASAQSRFGDGVNTAGMMRLRYGVPEDVGLNSDTLALIDKVAKEAIRVRATPSCQILVAKDGQVVYHKSFGYHTYANRFPAALTDIYDLASVTKICATTLSIMRLVDEGKLSLDDTFGEHVPLFRGTNKANLKIRDVMAHHGRLKAWIPFYKETMVGRRRKRPNSSIYKTSPREGYNTKVTERMYMKDSYKDVVWKRIVDSPLRPNYGYKYSDLGFYMLMKVVESVSDKPFTQYITKTFYEPMGLQATLYNPLEKFSTSTVVPTERDNYFRMGTVQGYVHDMGAAMLDGVSGHAGLFATSADLAAILQMWLNGGHYAGQHFMNESTIRQFTTRYAGSTRRGIGFDMLETNPSKKKNLSALASRNTFGHLGFTGNAVWADPDNNIIFIFLSNRTYPSMNNKKLYARNYRPKAQAIVYRALMDRPSF